MHYENLASQAERAAIRREESELYRITMDAVKDKDGKKS